MRVFKVIHKVRERVEGWMHKANPCNAPEDSIRWGIVSTLFPDCFCCAGLRGFCYGVILTSLIAWWVM